MNRAFLASSALSALVAAIAVAGLGSTGCSTEGYCFRDCDDKNSDGGDAAKDGTGGWGDTGPLIDAKNEQFIIPTEAGDAPETCVQSNGGSEICDGKDNDCNGVIDDGFDLNKALHCGTCDNNCLTQLNNVDPASITCEWDGTAGKKGTCKFTKCAQDWWDLDKNPANGCEHPCVKTADDDKLCNNLDDDCDGLKDEDVNLCTSITDCGKCGGSCQVLHGVPECKAPAQPPCDTTNTKCAIQKCDDGWWDLDNSYATGCEYQCDLTNGGVEVCGDGLDNDCNGKIDGADPNVLSDPQLGKPCYGDPQGECATPAHEGKTTCVGQQVQCVGPNVIVGGQIKETCNALDDDCDGTVDNNLIDAGKPCGVSNIFPCQMGAQQCVSGALVCIGDIGPGTEMCNGLDDDCNGQIDDNTKDTVGTCGQSDVGECKLGTKVCTGGMIQCVGNIDSKLETCNGKDDDCDGTADNNLTDTGATCGQNGTTPCKLGTIQCGSGVLKCVGFIDPSPETCNGIDDDCNGTIDDNVPGAGASCGLNNTFPCKKGAMQCVTGNMVCIGAIDPKPETCNGVDDNCDGLIDNNTTDSGGACGLSSTLPCKKGALQCQNGLLACVGNIDPKPETCNGVDDNCDGTVDNNPSGTGADCGQNNTLPCKYGKTVCQAGAIVCSGNIDPKPETCNGVDDNCNGQIDDGAQGTGVACGTSNVFPCAYGSTQCIAGAISCVGAVNPKAETCNGTDDDCDGTIDKTGGNPPPDSVGACNVPTPPPPGATSPCKAGTKACVGGQVQCQGSVGPTGSSDTCGVDANCDGQLTNQPNLQTDKFNCGTCGHDCTAGAVHANWGCVAGACVFQGCQSGYWDLNADQKCEYACVFVSAQEACNNADDNCNGTVDEGVTAPSPVQVCGVSPAATATECTTGVTVACVAGAFKCTFPAGVCNPTCAGTAEICDTLDNNCNGQTNENVPSYGQPCASDDGQPAPGDGACRTTGTYVCNGANATKCSAVKDLTKAGPELCDGVDNDCDGLVDETFNSKGSNPTYFVKPVATRISATRWIYSYEASRPSATASTSGSGNGYVTSAPVGVTLDKTPSCSVQGKIPWFNVTGTEVDQTCTAMGGFACATADWQTACQATVACKWGYATRGAPCTASWTGSKYCNLGPFDADGVTDLLFITGNPALPNCRADWSGLQGNTTATDKIFDITGNLREITKNAANQYKLMGGAFNTQSEDGAACQFTFYTVDQNFQFFDTGFRCCFSADPTL
ncbi:MAG: hypothetical protein HY898_11510 [Deltaproteobacteria bacterium]|nr:hypothetical protein [Deltaproteobacteria bacterium]